MTQRQILRPPFHDMVPQGQLIEKQNNHHTTQSLSL